MFKSPQDAFKDVVEYMEANKGNIRGLRLYAFSKSAGSDDLLLTDRSDVLSQKREKIEQSEIIELLGQYTQYIKYDDPAETNSSNTIGLEIVLKNESKVTASSLDIGSLEIKAPEMQFLCDLNETEAFFRENKVV